MHRIVTLKRVTEAPRAGRAEKNETSFSNCAASGMLLGGFAPAAGAGSSKRSDARFIAKQAGADAPQPPANAQKPATGSSSNPFPEDTNSVPVVPTSNSPAAPRSGFRCGLRERSHCPATQAIRFAVPTIQPQKPPADRIPGSSDSNAGLDQLLKPPPDTRKEKGQEANAAPKEGPKEDENVGSYYLQSKDWKGALSRFESAMVLDPENPDVYWGLAEAERHLGQFAGSQGELSQGDGIRSGQPPQQGREEDFERALRWLMRGRSQPIPRRNTRLLSLKLVS